jgi:hypothetical protein
MFRSRQFIGTCLAMVAFSAMGKAGDADTAAVVEASAPSRTGQVVEIADLQPFTHVASIPVGSDSSSIKFENIKLVEVATKRRLVTNQRYCNNPSSEPGQSMYCESANDESRVPAYRVTYSYRGQPLASDEYGNTYLTFSVYFRADELSSQLREALSSGKARRIAAAKFFEIVTSKESASRIAIDQAKSTLCDGRYEDGNWVRTNPSCQDSVVFNKVVGASPYLTVMVNPAASALLAGHSAPSLTAE